MIKKQGGGGTAPPSPKEDPSLSASGVSYKDKWFTRFALEGTFMQNLFHKNCFREKILKHKTILEIFVERYKLHSGKLVNIQELHLLS